MAKSLHLVKNSDDDINYCVERVASEITKECMSLKKKQDAYQIDNDKDPACESVGDTTASLQSKISSKWWSRHWAFALCGEVTQNIKATGTMEDNHIHTQHKEAPSRVKADQADQHSLWNTLDVIINPLDDESHPEGALWQDK